MAVDETLKNRLSIKRPLPSPSEIGDAAKQPATPVAPGRGTPAVPPEKTDYQPPPKKSDPLPRPGDAYRACARFLNRLSTEQHYLHFVDKDCFCQAYAYGDLRRIRWAVGTDATGGPVIELRFVVGSLIVDVRIEGRNLEDIHYWIGEHAMTWVWEQPKGFKTKDDHAVVITKLSFVEVKT